MRLLTLLFSIVFALSILIFFLSFQSSDSFIKLRVIGQNNNNRTTMVNNRNNLEEIKFVCKSVELRGIWLSLLQERELISTLFTSQLKEEYNCSDMLDVKKVDLNDDGKPEYAIRVTSLCSATGNCPTAFNGVIDADNSDVSSKIFLFSLGMINFELKPIKTKGYKDILLRFNGSPYENYLELYRFDGKAYQRIKCFDEDKRMRITPTKCWKDEN